MSNFNNSMMNVNPMVNSFSTAQRSQFPSSYFNPSVSGTTASTNNIVWVQGIEGAKAWQLNPNSMVILLDSEVEGKMYIKVSDNIGMSSLRIFNYVEDKQPTTNENVTNNQNLDLSQYVKKDELKVLIKELLAENEQSISTAATTTNAVVPATTTGAAKVVTVKK